MKESGEFATILDLGDMGEQEVVVKWQGYTPRRVTEDDLPEIEIMSVRLITSSKLSTDITRWLTKSAIDSLEVEAREQFPSQEDQADFHRGEFA